MTVRLAVVSDLHCHPRNYAPVGTLQYSDPDPSLGVKCDPMLALEQLIKSEKLAADIVLAPGDLTHQSHPQGFGAGWDVVKRIATALKGGKPVGTMGNHDVDSRHKYTSPGEDVFQFAKAIGQGFPCSSQPQSNKFWQRGYCFLEKGPLRVLIVNSVAGHLDPAGAERSSLTPKCLEEITQELEKLPPKFFQVALVHHHPIPHKDLGGQIHVRDILAGGDELLELLQRHKFQIVVHGHKHRPRLVYAHGGSKSIPIFAAGSFSAAIGIAGTGTRNLFHIVTLHESTLRACDQPGTIRSYEFNYGNGWTDPNTQSANFPAKTGFGCRLPPRELAIWAESFLNSKTVPLARWDVLLDEIPQLNFLIPQDFDEFHRVLAEEFAINLDFERNSDIPRTIGKVVPEGDAP